MREALVLYCIPRRRRKKISFATHTHPSLILIKLRQYEQENSSLSATTSASFFHNNNPQGSIYLSIQNPKHTVLVPFPPPHTHKKFHHPSLTHSHHASQHVLLYSTLLYSSTRTRSQPTRDSINKSQIDKYRLTHPSINKERKKANLVRSSYTHKASKQSSNPVRSFQSREEKRSPRNILFLRRLPLSFPFPYLIIIIIIPPWQCC